MNNDNLEKFIAEMESIKMTSYEKNEMRNTLSSFAVSYTSIVSPYHKFQLIMKKTMAVTFVAIISIGSLSNFASGTALPGDTLYPVKIAHEELKVAATFDTKKKISYEIKRTEKRIQEATKLASEQKLDTETQTEIAKEIEKQTNKIQEHIKEVTTNEPKEGLILNSELKSRIKINSQALRKATSIITKEKKVDSIENTEEIEGIDNTQPIMLVSFESHTDKEQEDIVEADTNEYVEITTSSAENLLDIIDNEVEEIELYEKETSETYIAEEIEDIAEEIEDILDDLEDITKEEEEEKENLQKEIAKEITSLEDILDIEERISLAKETYQKNLDNGASPKEEIENIEQKFMDDINVLIGDKKYKQAFLLYEKILGIYREALITQEVEVTTGIEASLEETEITQETHTIKNTPLPEEVIEKTERVI